MEKDRLEKWRFSWRDPATGRTRRRTFTSESERDAFAATMRQVIERERQLKKQSRHAFQQNVAVRQQADQQRVYQMALADDDLAHFRTERIHEDAFAFDALVEFLDVDDFAHCFILLNFITSFPRPAYSVRHTLSGKSGSACSADKPGSAHSARQTRPRTFCPQLLRLHGENLAVLPSDLVF